MVRYLTLSADISRTMGNGQVLKNDCGSWKNFYEALVAIKSSWCHLLWYVALGGMNACFDFVVILNFSYYSKSLFWFKLLSKMLWFNWSLKLWIRCIVFKIKLVYVLRLNRFMFILLESVMYSVINELQVLFYVENVTSHVCWKFLNTLIFSTKSRSTLNYTTKN